MTEPQPAGMLTLIAERDGLREHVKKLQRIMQKGRHKVPQYTATHHGRRHCSYCGHVECGCGIEDYVGRKRRR